MLKEMERLVLTKDEAIKFLRKKRTIKGYQCYIGASINLPIKDKEDRVFPGYTTIPVSFKVAENIINDLLKNLEDRGAMIRIQYSERCIFIG